MGNQETYSPNPSGSNFQSSLKITLDKDIYSQEETVTGHIWLELMFPIIILDIKISLLLSEHWTYLKNDEDVYSENNEVYLNNYLLNIRSVFNIPTPEIQLAPGKYKFPFMFTLNKDILPTFEYPRTDKRAFVRYSLHAETLSNYVKFTAKANLIVKSKPLILNSKLKFDSCVNVRSWTFFNQGTVIFTVSYPTNNYKMGDEVPLEIIINNTRGNISTHSIIVSIIRKIHFKKKRDKIEFNFSSTISEQKFPIVVAAQSKKNLVLNMPIKDNKSKVFGYSGYVNPYPNINDNTMLTPTIYCPTFKCEYEMKVVLYFEKFVTSSYLPKVVMPIAITHDTNNEYMLPKQDVIGFQDELVMNQVNNGEHNNNNQGMEFGEDKSAPDAMFDYHHGNNELQQNAPIMDYQNINETNHQQNCRPAAQSAASSLNGHNMQMINDFQQNYDNINNYDQIVFDFF